MRAGQLAPAAESLQLSGGALGVCPVLVRSDLGGLGAPCGGREGGAGIALIDHMTIVPCPLAPVKEVSQ